MDTEKELVNLNQNKMKGKLIKTKDGFYVLNDEFGNYIHGKLSLKNCQVIERGYDLDELVNKRNPIPENSISAIITLNIAVRTAYIDGFQKAIEILGNKNLDNYKIWKAGQEYWKTSGESMTFEELMERREELLQQTEWDVDIVMEEAAIGDKYTPEPKPKLDADGCLILKRVI